jgi:hypothetical protein
LSSGLVVPLLAAPLVGLTVWVVRGALRPPAIASVPPRAAEPRGPLPGLPLPSADLPADRLEEQVDGAADTLRADGCRRLLHWRFEDPPAEAEVLVFASADAAHRIMEREAGPERTAGPGEEAQLAEQFAYFRRGSVFVRIFADPGASGPGDALARRAAGIDRALTAGGPL